MQFSKMHGLGNDFMVIDAITQNISLYPKLIRRLANRHLGVGFDQLLIIEPSCNPNFDFHYRIFNADGSEVAQCGNGARCLAHFVYSKKLTNKRDICVSTSNGYVILKIIENELIQANMGEPNLKLLNKPFYNDELKGVYVTHIATRQKLLYNLVSIGNLHCIIQVDNVENAAVETLGPILEKYRLFPEHVNVGFMQIITREYIRLRVYERGVGETKACGSGACAAAAIGINYGLLEEKVNVELPGGRLSIIWKGAGYPLYMIGSATLVYDGFLY